LKALIIGAAGFVGSYLAAAIKENMACDVVVTRLENEKLDIPDVEERVLNILDKKAIHDLLIDVHPKYIFHLAAQSSVKLSWENPALTVNVNVKGSLNLFDVVRTLNYEPKVLVIGSGEEYGYIEDGHCPISEEEFLRPGNIYAATKCCQNMMAKVYAKAYGINLVMTRSFNHMGPRQLPQFVISDFCRQVARIEKDKQEPIITVGNLKAKRDFTDVRDVTNAYVKLALYGISGEIYNVGSGKAIAIEDILNIILSQSKKKIEVKVDKSKLRPIDVPIIEADISKLYKTTGWMPSIPTEQTISDMLEYWRANV